MFSIIYQHPSGSGIKAPASLTRADVLEANFLTHRNGCGHLTAKQVFAYGQYGDLAFPALVETHNSLKCRLSLAFKQQKQITKQNKNLSALLMPDDAILDPRRGRNCQTHLVPAGKHGVSLEQNFSPTLILTLSCPSSGLFLRVGPSSPPPLLSGHCPMVTRSFS